MSVLSKKKIVTLITTVAIYNKVGLGGKQIGVKDNLIIVCALLAFPIRHGDLKHDMFPKMRHSFC